MKQKYDSKTLEMANWYYQDAKSAVIRNAYRAIQNALSNSDNQLWEIKHHSNMSEAKYRELTQMVSNLKHEMDKAMNEVEPNKIPESEEK